MQGGRSAWRRALRRGGSARGRPTPRGTPVRRGTAGSQPHRRGRSPSHSLVISLLGEHRLAPFLPRAVARLASARRAAPWWLYRAHARRYEWSLDPRAWRTLEGPRWWAQLADAVARGSEGIGLFDYFRRRSRAAGLPAHHPFLALDLIGVVLTLPPEDGCDPGLTRPLLRTAMRGLVPKAVRLRPGEELLQRTLGRLPCRQRSRADQPPGGGTERRGCWPSPTPRTCGPSWKGALRGTRRALAVGYRTSGRS